MKEILEMYERSFYAKRFLSVLTTKQPKARLQAWKSGRGRDKPREILLLSWTLLELLLCRDPNREENRAGINVTLDYVCNANAR